MCYGLKITSYSLSSADHAKLLHIYHQHWISLSEISRESKKGIDSVVDGIWFTVLVKQPDFGPEAVYKFSRYSSILYKSLMPRTMTWIASVPRTGKESEPEFERYRICNRVSVTRISQSVGNRLSSFEEQIWSLMASPQW